MEIADLSNLLGGNMTDACVAVLIYDALSDEEIHELVSSRFGEPAFDRQFSFRNDTY
jgi:hypothetical protein